MTQHHYYGSTGYGWQCGQSREEVLGKLARAAGTSILERARKHSGGLYAQVCRVELPQAAHYDISNYMPSVITKEDGVNEARKGERVPTSEFEQVLITNMKGRAIPYVTKSE